MAAPNFCSFTATSSICSAAMGSVMRNRFSNICSIPCRVWLRWRLFELYIASSASRNIVSNGRNAPCRQDQPHEMNRGHAKARSLCSLITLAMRCCTPAMPSSSISGRKATNSSPPMRNNKSCSRKLRRSTQAAARSKSSPAACPSVSLTSFRPSTSHTSTANGPLPSFFKRSISYSKKKRLYKPVS